MSENGISRKVFALGCRKHFTLIEMLVVIAIISILSSMLLPSLRKAASTAKTVQCLNLVKQFSMVNNYYSADYHGWQWPVFVGPGTSRVWWVNNATICDYFGFDVSRVVNSGSLTYWPREFICPEAEFSLANTRSDGTLCAINTSIGVNITKPSNVSGGEWYPSSAGNYRAFHQRQIKTPSKTLQFVDATGVQVVRSMSDSWAFYYINGETNASGVSAYRHNNAANVGFFDGHGRSVADAELALNDDMWYVNQ